jgi:hypothetical protein
MKRFKWQKGLGKRKEKLINLSNHFCLIAWRQESLVWSSIILQLCWAPTFLFLFVIPGAFTNQHTIHNTSVWSLRNISWMKQSKLLLSLYSRGSRHSARSCLFSVYRYSYCFMSSSYCFMKWWQSLLLYLYLNENIL